MKLLIVDDSSAVYRRLIELLGGVEHLTSLSVARSAHEAELKCCEVQPDAIVMDVQLPDANGLDALHQLKASCPRAQAFIFSNHCEYRSKALSAGADGFYDKSMEFEQLIARLLAFASSAAQARLDAVSEGSLQ